MTTTAVPNIPTTINMKSLEGSPLSTAIMPPALTAARVDFKRHELSQQT